MEIANKQKFRVKVIVNPTCTPSFDLRFQLPPEQKANLKIAIKSANDLERVVDYIKTNLPKRYDFNVEFNWVNTPENIKNNTEFKSSIMDLFASGRRTEPAPTTPHPTNVPYAELAVEIRDRIKKYGANPDFHRINVPKVQVACRNFVRTTLGKQSMSDVDADAIIAIVRTMI